MPVDQPVMTAQDVGELLLLFEQNELDVVIDGGWGVDALLGEQTRQHADLDIAIAYNKVGKLRQVFEESGFVDVPRGDTREVNFVMGDEHGRQVDIHTYSLDRENHPEQGLDYPPDSLNGKGTILGHPVKCIDARNMVKFHTGYDLDDNDYQDVKALCLHFGIELPEDYARFEAGTPD